MIKAKCKTDPVQTIHCKIDSTELTMLLPSNHEDKTNLKLLNANYTFLQAFQSWRRDQSSNALLFVSFFTGVKISSSFNFAIGVKM